MEKSSINLLSQKLLKNMMVELNPDVVDPSVKMSSEVHFMLILALN